MAMFNSYVKLPEGNSLNSSHVDMTMSAVSSTRNAQRAAAKASQDLTKLETASNASETELLSAA